MGKSATASAKDSGRTTRRRGAVFHKAIIDAALDQLRDVGYTKLTMESVATAAGTGKAALYSRWPNKDALVADALRSVLPDPASLILGEDPLADIHALLRSMRDAMNVTHGNAFQAVKQEVGAAAGFLHVMVQQHVMDPCSEGIRGALKRGCELGVLRPGADNDRVAAVGPAMLIHYAVTVDPIIPDSFLTSVIEDVIRPLIQDG